MTPLSVVQYRFISWTENIEMSCVELRNMFLEKNKKIPYNHLEDYDYVKLLYENAKIKKYSEKKTPKRNKDENTFEDIYMFLREMESEGVFEEVEAENNYYEEYLWEERTRHQHQIYSGQNSDYSFWSLDEQSFLSESISQYSDLLRLQARHLYVQLWVFL